MGRKQKTPAALLTAQELIGVEEINDDILYTKSKVIYAYISVRSMSDSLLSEQDRQMASEKLVRAMENEKKIWQLLSIPRVINTQALINHLISLKNQTDNDARLELLDGEIDSVQDMARNGAKEPMIVVKVWEREDKYGEKNLNKRVTDIITNLKLVQGLSAVRLKNADIAFLCKQLAELGAPQADEEDTRELAVIKGHKKHAADVDLINEITPPGGITVYNNKIMLGGVMARIYGAIGYPPELNYGWLTDIMNNTEAVTCVTFDPANPSLLGDALSRSVRSNAAEAISTKDVRESKALSRKAASANEMIDEIDVNHETIGLTSIITMPFTSNEEGFDEVCNRTLTLFGNHKIKLKVLGQLQREGFQTIAPYSEPPKVIGQAFSRLMPLFTLAGGSPMCINSYQDEDGFYFARTSTGNIVAINMWYRGHDRTNTNFFLLGKAGRGKSTIIKHIAQIEFMRGTKLLFIDPESEFREITMRLGGVVFYVGGGSSKINIFQVRPSPKDDEDEDESTRLYNRNQDGNDLAMHLKNLDIFFRTYMVDATEILYSVLEQCCLELYRNFGMDWDTDFRDIPANKFPIMSDLYEYLLERGKTDKNCEELAARISSAAIGSDSFIFNGHTNIDLTADVICFDTNALQNASDKIKRAQYLNILGLCWEIMSRNRDEKVMLFCDEAYLLVDERLPQSLMYLRNIEKRCRKYSGALGIATHSVVDLLHPNIRQYGQAILDISDYKFFLAAEGQNLKEISNLYDLTELQQEILRSGGRGEALGMFGSSMLHLNFVLPQYKLDNMGKAGGN